MATYTLSAENPVATGTANNDTFLAGLGGNYEVDGAGGADTLVVDYSSTGGSVAYYIGDDAAGWNWLDASSQFDDIATALAVGGRVQIYDNYSGYSVTYTNIEKVNLSTGDYEDLLIVTGNGTYDGGWGTDTLYADWSGATEAISWTNTAPSGSPATIMTGVKIAGVERLLVSTGAGSDLLDNSANATGDVFVTGLGNDTIAAGAGDDRIDAGAGDDSIVSGTGYDWVDGGDGSDTLTVDWSTIGYSAVGYYIGSDAQGWTWLDSTSGFTEIHGAIASGGHNQIAEAYHGYAVEYNNVEAVNLTTGADSDLLLAEAGGIYDGGEGIDTLYADLSGITQQIIWYNGSAWDPTGGDQVLISGVDMEVAGVERMLLQTGSGNDSLRNNEHVADDVFITGDGNDYVDAGDGNDHIDTGSGDDNILVGLGIDFVDGGAGSDTLLVDYAGQISYSHVVYNIGSDAQGWTWLDSASSFEDIAAALAAGGDTQIYNHDFGYSATFRNIETVWLTTGYYDDLHIAQGAGKYVAGSGVDTFFADWSVAAAGIEWVNDPVPSVLTPLSNGVEVQGMDRLLLQTGLGNDLLDNSANATDDVFITNDGNDSVDAGAGSDRIDTGAGDDHIATGTGNDTVDGGDGIDVLNVDWSTIGYTAVGYYVGDDIQGWTWVAAGSTFAEIGNALATGGQIQIYESSHGFAVDYRNTEVLNLTTGSSDDLLIVQGPGHYDGGIGVDTLYADWSNTTMAIVWDNGNLQGPPPQLVDGVSVASVERLLLATGSADDAIANVGALADDMIMTGAGNDSVNAGHGSDTVDGGDGDDFLDGGMGSDFLAGGLGNDIYMVDDTWDTVVEAFDEGLDTVIAGASFTLTANLEHLHLSGSAAIDGTGNAAANLIVGNDAANVLDGSGGDDTLDGGMGNDSLYGGGGSDTYIVGDIRDAVYEDAGKGNDTVIASASYTLSANIETLQLVGTAESGVGNSGNNTLIGTGGMNLLNGGLGADTMTGGYGSDTYVVDNVGDVIVEESENGGRDTVRSSINYTLGATVENLTLTGTRALKGTGNDGANLIDGNSGANLLDGGLGADTLAGGAGGDSYIVDDAGDMVVEFSGGGTDTVNSSITYALADNVENLALTGIDAIDGTGNSASNTLVGNSAVNTLDGGLGADKLDGGQGADILKGGAGNDSYTVDDSADLIEEYAGEGTDSVKSSVSYTLPGNVEKLTLTGSADIYAIGSVDNNTLTGNRGNNLLMGEDGKDTLKGNDGDDVLHGGTGSDLLTGGTGADMFVFDTVAGTGNIDTLKDFRPGVDTIALDDAIFSAFDAEVSSVLEIGQFYSGAGVKTAHDANDRLVYNTSSGALYYDADGQGGVDAVQLAVVGSSTHPTLTMFDFTIV